MIFDSTVKFSTEQAVTVTAVSAKSIDLGVANRDIGVGQVVPLYIGVDTKFFGATSVQVELQTSNTANFTIATTVASTGAVLASNLVQGYQFSLQSVPKNVLGRYVRLNYVVDGTATAGTISAGINMGHQANG